MLLDEFIQLTEFHIPLNWKWGKAPCLKESGKGVVSIPGMGERAITTSKLDFDWGDCFNLHAGYYSRGGFGWDAYDAMTALRSELDCFYGVIQSVLPMFDPDLEVLKGTLRQCRIYRPTYQELHDLQFIKDKFLLIEQGLSKMYF